MAATVQAPNAGHVRGRRALRSRVFPKVLFRSPDARHDARRDAQPRPADRRHPCAGRIPVRTILDAGCGIGLLRKPFAQVLPRARYTGLEASEYLCGRYGWLRGSIAATTRRALPSRPRRSATTYCNIWTTGQRRARLANFARLTRAALYVSALTIEDWRANCDRKRTDRAVHLRPGEWYRRRLQAPFPLPGFRRLAAQGRDRDPLGHGAARLKRLIEVFLHPSHQRRMHRRHPRRHCCAVVDERDQHERLAACRRHVARHAADTVEVAGLQAHRACGRLAACAISRCRRCRRAAAKR